MFPRFKKRIKHFIESEDGLSNKHSLISAGFFLSAAAFFNFINAPVLVNSRIGDDIDIHASHATHGSHSSHGSHHTHANLSSHHTHATHGSHSSHGTHTTHGSHSSHGTHATHCSSLLHEP